MIKWLDRMDYTQGRISCWLGTEKVSRLRTYMTLTVSNRCTVWVCRVAYPFIFTGGDYPRIFTEYFQGQRRQHIAEMRLRHGTICLYCPYSYDFVIRRFTPSRETCDVAPRKQIILKYLLHVVWLIVGIIIQSHNACRNQSSRSAEWVRDR